MESTSRSSRRFWLISINCPIGAALKVPLGELAESKENVRSALNRAIHKGDRNVTTASDDDFLYVWNETE